MKNCFFFFFQRAKEIAKWLGYICKLSSSSDAGVDSVLTILSGLRIEYVHLLGDWTVALSIEC